MENKFQQLKSISDIVDTMIKGLKKEWVKIDMNTYGDLVDDVCFGCAATNTLCELMQEPFTENNIVEYKRRGKMGLTESELDSFEEAINDFRCSNIILFLYNLGKIKNLLSFSLPSYKDIEYYKKLPILHTDNYKDELHHYEAYRDFLISKGL